MVICAKTAKPIEMLFGLWARMCPRNNVLDWDPQVLRDVAMATNFLAFDGLIITAEFCFAVWVVLFIGMLGI